MATVFIDGEAGTTGLGIRERLAGVDGVRVLSIDPALRKDGGARRAMMEEVDLVVLCLPDAAARESAALAGSLGARAPKVLDASTAHRVDPDWVYGFAELAAGQARAIGSARLVANPGCYATGAIALLRPLVEGGLVPRDFPVTVTGVSGYSGGGRSMIEGHEASGGPAFEMYALGLEHKHVPELQRYTGLTRRPLFMPAVAHLRQGMLVSVPLHLDMLPGRPSMEALREALEGWYDGAELVRVAPAGGAGALDVAGMAGSDVMELGVFGHAGHGQAVLVARLDNLGKGASGAAVQNIRLMLGLGAASTPVRELVGAV